MYTRYIYKAVYHVHNVWMFVSVMRCVGIIACILHPCNYLGLNQKLSSFVSQVKNTKKRRVECIHLESTKWKESKASVMRERESEREMKKMKMKMSLILCKLMDTTFNYHKYIAQWMHLYMPVCKYSLLWMELNRLIWHDFFCWAYKKSSRDWASLFYTRVLWYTFREKRIAKIIFIEIFCEMFFFHPTPGSYSVLFYFAGWGMDFCSNSPELVDFIQMKCEINGCYALALDSEWLKKIKHWESFSTSTSNRHIFSCHIPCCRRSRSRNRAIFEPNKQWTILFTTCKWRDKNRKMLKTILCDDKKIKKRLN